MTRACDNCGGPCIPKDGRAKHKRFCSPACSKQWGHEVWRTGTKKKTKPRRARGPRTPRFQVSGVTAERVRLMAEERGMTPQEWLSWSMHSHEERLRDFWRVLTLVGSNST